MPFPTKTEDSSGVMVMHVRRNHSSTDNVVGDGMYSTMPSNIPVGGGVANTTLPAHLKQLDDYYAEIRHW